MIYYGRMVDVAETRPARADTWKPAQTAAPTPLSGEHVVDKVAGLSGATRLKLDTATFLGRPAPDLRAGSGVGQAGPGIGEAKPLAAQPFVEPQTIYTSPLGEVRI